MRLKAGMIQINVTDLEAARAFYGEQLGIDLINRWGPEAPFELDVRGPTVLVYLVRDGKPSGYPHVTGVTAVFYTEDLDATIAAWTSRGVEFVPIEWSEDGTGTAPCPFGRFIAFRDPFGNVHELLQPHD